jgi:hypothetical protein
MLTGQSTLEISGVCPFARDQRRYLRRSHYYWVSDQLGKVLPQCIGAFDIRTEVDRRWNIFGSKGDIVAGIIRASISCSQFISTSRLAVRRAQLTYDFDRTWSASATVCAGDPRRSRWAGPSPCDTSGQIGAPPFGPPRRISLLGETFDNLRRNPYARHILSDFIRCCGDIARSSLSFLLRTRTSVPEGQAARISSLRAAPAPLNRRSPEESS